MSCTVYTTETLIEINEGMSELLLDKQVDTENENLKIKIPRFMQALVKCAIKIKESRRKQADVLPSKNKALCVSLTTVNLLLFNVL